jgi:exo-beta-1,3-glucanase (GH17 family)
MAAPALPGGPVLAELIQSRSWVAYAPSQPNNPNLGIQPTVEQIRSDLLQLHGEGFRGLVTYTLDGVHANVPQLARQIGFTSVIAGLFWYDSAQLARELSVIDTVDLDVDAYVVGNEGLTAGRYSLADLLAQMEMLRLRTGKPVTTTETYLQYQGNPALVAAGDFLFPNFQPWFNAALDPTDVDEMVQAVVGEVRALEQLAANRLVIVKETWWPTSGPAGASAANQVEFFRQLAAESVFFVWPEAYDQPWKMEISPFGIVGPSWGLHYSDRTPKPIVSELAGVYQGRYFATRDLLPGAINFLRQVVLANGVPQNEATSSELQTLSGTNNSIAPANRFFNPAQAGFWTTTLVLSHALRRADPAFTAGLSDQELLGELSATIGSLETIANSPGAVYSAATSSLPAGIAFFHNYDSETLQPRSGPLDREVPSIDNAYFAAGLWVTAAYLRWAVAHLGLGATGVALLDLAGRADALARRINFTVWMDPVTGQFRQGGTNDPEAGVFLDRIHSESRFVPLIALALGQITRPQFDAVMSSLIRQSRSGARSGNSPPVERISSSGTALETFVPTLFVPTELETLFGQGTLMQSVLAVLETGHALGLPAAGATGVANGGVPSVNGGANTFLTLGLSPAEFPDPSYLDRAVLVPAAAAMMAGATGRLWNPRLQSVGVEALRNLDAATEELDVASQIDAQYGAPNYLDFGSALVNGANPVRGFLETAQLVIALLNHELGGGFLESLLRQDPGGRVAIEAYREALNVREAEFLPSGSGNGIPRGNASGDRVWHLNNVTDATTYTLAVGASGIYRVKFRYSNSDTGVFDTVQVSVNGNPVSSFTTVHTGDWNEFTETDWLPLGELLPGTFELTLTLASTDGFGIDFDTISLSSSPRAWHNERNPRDASGDTLVSPFDALLIINDLITLDAHPLEPPPSPGQVPPYIDVNGDGHATPLDLLIVINYLIESSAVAAQQEAIPNAAAAIDSAAIARQPERAAPLFGMQAVWPTAVKENLAGPASAAGEMSSGAAGQRVGIAGLLEPRGSSERGTADPLDLEEFALDDQLITDVRHAWQVGLGMAPRGRQRPAR